MIELTSNGKKYSFQLLIGNKCDLPVSERQISFEQASIWAKQHSMEYFEASAVTGEGMTRVNRDAKVFEPMTRTNIFKHKFKSGVSDAFSSLVAHVLSSVDQTQLDPSFLLEKRIKMCPRSIEKS